MPDEPEPDEFEQFKQEVFWTVVIEDYNALWEPLWWLRGDGAIEGQSELERQVFAERALRELYGEGLIYFFRIPPGGKIDPSSLDETLRLPSDEMEAALRADWWRGPGEFDEGSSDIWFAPTEAGEAAASDPPDRIRKLFRLREPDVT